MSETDSPTLAELIGVRCRVAVGRGRPDDYSSDFLAHFAARPELVTAARAELSKLVHMDQFGRVFSRDHVSKARHDALQFMLAAYDGAQSQ